MKKIFKSIICLSLVFCILSVNTVYASEAREDQSYGEEEIVVAYLNGVPIVQSDIEDGLLVNAEKMQLIEQNELLTELCIEQNFYTTSSLLSSSTRLGGDVYRYGDTLYVATGYNVEVTRQLSSYGLSQTTTDLHLTSDGGEEFAQTLYTSSLQMATNCLIGLVKAPYGPMYAVVSTLNAIYNNAKYQEIRALTDAEKNVRIQVVKTNYASFMYVSEWNSRTVDLSVMNNPPTVYEYIESINYGN